MTASTPKGRAKDLMEKLAAIEHKRWADWHQHAYSNWTPINITRWNQQANTEYKDLPEPIKELDRREVRRYLPLINEAISQAVNEFADEAANAVKNHCLCFHGTRESLINEILKLKAAYAKGEKGE